MTSKIRNEITSLLDLEEDSYSSTDEYHKAIAAAASKLSDDDWEGLSEDAQDWINEASSAINDGDDLPEFSDEVKEKKEDKPTRRRGRPKKEEPEDSSGEGEKEEPENSSGEGEKEAEKKPTRRRGRPKKEEPEDGDADQEEKPARRRGRRAGGTADKPTAGFRSKQIFIENNFDITDEDVMEILETEGIKYSLQSLSVLRSELNMTMRLLKEYKLLANND